MKIFKVALIILTCVGVTIILAGVVGYYFATNLLTETQCHNLIAFMDDESNWDKDTVNEKGLNLPEYPAIASTFMTVEMNAGKPVNMVEFSEVLRNTCLRVPYEPLLYVISKIAQKDYETVPNPHQNSVRMGNYFEKNKIPHTNKNK